MCHDFEDAVSAGVVRPDQLPGTVADVLGAQRGAQLGALIRAMIATTVATGWIGLDARHAAALAAFRQFNYDRIYLRPASRTQAGRVVDMLRALVEHYASHPEHLEEGEGDPLVRAVTYVAGMTDRFACRQAIDLLAWPESRLPTGIDR